MTEKAYGSETVGRQPLDVQSANIDWDKPSVVAMSRNPSVTFHKVWYRGYPVPHLAVFKVPVNAEGEQVYPMSDSSDGPLIVHPHDGRFRYELTLDDRWAFDFDRMEDIEKIVPLLADAMAVAAGYACHGSSNRLNAHGPTVLSYHRDEPAGDPVIG